MQYLSFNKPRHWQWSPTGSAIWEKALTFSTITQFIYDPQIRTTLEIFFACNPSHILSFATEIAWKIRDKNDHSGTGLVRIVRLSNRLQEETDCLLLLAQSPNPLHLPNETTIWTHMSAWCRSMWLQRESSPQNMVAGIACASYHEQWPKRACAIHEQMMFSQPWQKI
jgi:hypothetical protein